MPHAHSLPPPCAVLGVKPMETWGGDDQSSSWDQEEEVEIGMWSNTGGQQDSRSHDHNTWNYKQKGPNKVPPSGSTVGRSPSITHQARG